MLTRVNHHLAPVMAETRDPAGFARLRELAEAGPGAAARKDARLAATRIATLLACKGGVIGDIAVGDCVELADTQRRVQARGGQKKVDFYLRLHALGSFPPMPRPRSARSAWPRDSSLSRNSSTATASVQARP